MIFHEIISLIVEICTEFKMFLCLSYLGIQVEWGELVLCEWELGFIAARWRRVSYAVIYLFSYQ